MPGAVPSILNRFDLLKSSSRMWSEPQFTAEEDETQNGLYDLFAGI